MKIIGQTTRGFILEASQDEVIGLAGDRNVPHRLEIPYGAKEIARYIGVEFDIASSWERLNALRKNEDALAKVCGQLRAMADLLEPISTVIETLDEKEAT